MVPSFAHLSPKTKCIAVQFTFLRQVSGLAKSLWVSTISGSSCKFSKSVSKVLKCFYSQFILVNQKPSCDHQFDWFFWKKRKRLSNFAKLQFLNWLKHQFCQISKCQMAIFCITYICYSRIEVLQNCSAFLCQFISFERKCERFKTHKAMKS